MSVGDCPEAKVLILQYRWAPSVTELILRGAAKETRPLVLSALYAIFIAPFRHQFPKSLLQFPFNTPPDPPCSP